MGLWDNYLSFNLYSAISPQLEICYKNSEKTKLYSNFANEESRFCKEEFAINAQCWSLEEMNIIVYPEKRVLKGIIKK
jgi:hypothetical protein